MSLRRLERSVHLIRATSNKPQAVRNKLLKTIREQAVHPVRPKPFKMQVTSLKPLGARLKLQATSVKLQDILPLIKFYKVKGEGLN